MEPLTLRKMVDELQVFALKIGESTQHAPILMTPNAVVPIIIQGDQYRGVMSDAVRAACAEMRPPMAVFINEAWALRKDAPDWARAAVSGEADASVASLTADMRDEVLNMYGEDDQGNFLFRSWRINSRTPGGLVLELEHSGNLDHQRPGEEWIGLMVGFVPRRDRPATPAPPQARGDLRVPVPRPLSVAEAIEAETSR